ncbi:MAG: recombinase family protein [Bacteroidaceae bacterium]|nr:recombinase family protein [Bacteroidaceae bacterium]
MRKGVIYARYSSHMQRDESIEQQIEECTIFARQNDIEIVGTYEDRAVSGQTDRRTGFQHMMRDAEKHSFDVVIAYKSNRIARSMMNALIYEDKLDKLGISTLYAKEEFGNTAAGRFALRTMMNVNQFYCENLSEDIRRGMRSNAENCKVNSALPFGYEKGSDGRFAIRESEARIVRQIFSDYLHGIPLAKIAEELNNQGIRTKRGGRWNKNSFHRLLSNENYIGVYSYIDIRIEHGVPAIVSEDVFRAVQNRLKDKKTVSKKEDFFLTGKLFCGMCASPMIGTTGFGKSGTAYHYYTCQGRRAHSCSKDSIPKDVIEREVAEITRDIVLQDETIEWLAESAVKYQIEASRSDEVSELKSELASNKKSIRNIMSAIESGVISVSLTTRLSELESRNDFISKELLKHDAHKKIVDKDRIIFALQKFKEQDVTNKAYQKRLISAFVKKVYVWDDHIDIHYYYTGKDDYLSIPTKSSYKGEYAPPHVTQANTVIVLMPDCFILHTIRKSRE